MLQSPRLKDHLDTIDIDQRLSNNALFENRYLQNIKKLYKHSGKRDDQKKIKDILDAAMFFTTSPITAPYLP